MTPSTTDSGKEPSADLTSIIGTATPLSPLQLNALKLDVRHTILTPDYLDKLVADNG